MHFCSATSEQDNDRHIESRFVSYFLKGFIVSWHLSPRLILDFLFYWAAQMEFAIGCIFLFTLGS